MASFLFSKVSIHDVMDRQVERVKAEVSRIPPDALMSASEHDLIETVVGAFALNVPVIHEEGIHIAHTYEKQIDVSRDPLRLIVDRSQPFYMAGSEVVIAIPFEGDPYCFNIRPQVISMMGQKATATEHELLLQYSGVELNTAAIKADYERVLQFLKSSLESLRTSSTQLRQQLTVAVTADVQARKAHILRDRGIPAALGLPIKARSGAPTTYAVPVTRKQTKIANQTVGSFRPEPALAAETYDKILQIISNMVRVIELSPHEFENITEEGLRSHSLVQLNGQFEGTARGETFNFSGKTDILIQADGKNVFIAECKFWDGEKAFLETITQLLGYVSWRDTKTAVLIFSRRSDFSSVLAKIKEVTSNHTNYKRHVTDIDETSFRYVFGQPNDPNR